MTAPKTGRASNIDEEKAETGRTMSKDQPRRPAGGFDAYEKKLVTQRRPIGPLQALKYHWLIPEQSPSYLEILSGIFAVGVTGVYVLGKVGGLSTRLFGVVIAAIGAVLMFVQWALVLQNVRLREREGKIGRGGGQ